MRHGSLGPVIDCRSRSPTGIAVVAAAIVARELKAATHQPELARREPPGPEAPAVN
jgi:hypothetical protein